jgi:hypothetical protein
MGKRDPAARKWIPCNEETLNHLPLTPAVDFAQGRLRYAEEILNNGGPGVGAGGSWLMILIVPRPSSYSFASSNSLAAIGSLDHFGSRNQFTGSFHFRWNGPRGPLLPGRLVGEDFNVNTADHGTGLKITVFAGVGVVEIGERNAVGSFVGEFKNG